MRRGRWVSACARYRAAAVQFAKLERIQIGGSKGRTLSASIAQMHADFTTSLATFQDVDYDPLDIANKRFDDHFYRFRTDVKQVERRLASVLNQGFEDCATVWQAFKLIDAFEGLLERDSLQADLLKKQADLISAYATDLREVYALFHREKRRSAEGFYLERDGPPLYMNMPPVAGSTFWVRGLIERVSSPMDKLRSPQSRATHRVLELEESLEVIGQHDALLQALHDFETASYDAWARGVEETSAAKLRQPLLVRDAETKLLAVNFDPDLVRLLREVHTAASCHLPPPAPRHLALPPLSTCCCVCGTDPPCAPRGVERRPRGCQGGRRRARGGGGVGSLQGRRAILSAW